MNSTSMKRIRTALAAAVFGLVLPAQDETPKKLPVGLEKLTAEWKAANKAYRAAMAQVRASDEYKAAREAKDNAKLRKLMGKLERPDAKVYRL